MLTLDDWPVIVAVVAGLVVVGVVMVWRIR